MPKKTLVYNTRDQKFDFSVQGLKPLTYHYLYYEGSRVANTLIKPLGGKTGDLIKTDANGQADFSFFLAASTVQAETAYEQAIQNESRLAAPKQVVLLDQQLTTVPTNFANTADSYAFLTIPVNVLPDSKTITPPAVTIYRETNNWDGGG